MIPECSGNHRTRLFVGEGNFSFTEALVTKHLTKHPNLAEAIIATELITEKELKSNCDRVGFDDMEPQGEIETLNRIAALKELGIQIHLGVDGTKLHEQEFLKGKIISRIHWNLPLNAQREGNFKALLYSFFVSCRAIQKSGDRIYITLLQGKNKEAPKSNFVPDWIFQQGYKAHIVTKSAPAGYKLIKKRKFLEDGLSRYPGYITRNSFSGKPLSQDQTKCIREFIFEKQKKCCVQTDIKDFQTFTDPNEEIKVKYCPIKIKDKTFNYAYYDCDTEDDSSDYSISDSEEITEKSKELKTNKGKSDKI